MGRARIPETRGRQESKNECPNDIPPVFVWLDTHADLNMAETTPAAMYTQTATGEEIWNSDGESPKKYPPTFAARNGDRDVLPLVLKNLSRLYF